MYYDFIIDHAFGGYMSSTTISPKFQVVIPKDIREQLHLKSGQKLTVVVKGGVVSLIPERSIESFRGFLKGMNAKNIRDERDR